MLSKTFCVFLPLQQRFGMLGSLKSKSSLDTYLPITKGENWMIPIKWQLQCECNQSVWRIIHQCGKCRLKLLHHNEVHFRHSGLLIHIQLFEIFIKDLGSINFITFDSGVFIVSPAVRCRCCRRLCRGWWGLQGLFEDKGLAGTLRILGIDEHLHRAGRVVRTSNWKGCTLNTMKK